MSANRLSTAGSGNTNSSRRRALGHTAQDPMQRLMTYGRVRPMRDPGFFEGLVERLLRRY